MLRIRKLAMTMVCGVLWHTSLPGTTSHAAEQFSEEQTGVDFEESSSEAFTKGRNEMADLEWWPWHGKNKTDGDKSCHAHLDCYTCSKQWDCHWCAHDEACHARGSPYGCVEGMSCNNTPPTPSPEDNSCAAHKTCGECATSAFRCHWCAHDNSCHTIGSPYGCLTGVDCYSNDRCERQEPELIKGYFFQQMGWVPFVIVMGIAFSCVCCSTLCLGAATGVKGAYDDLMDASISGGQTMPVQEEYDPLLPPATIQRRPEMPGGIEVRQRAARRSTEGSAKNTMEKETNNEPPSSDPQSSQGSASQGSARFIVDDGEEPSSTPPRHAYLDDDDDDEPVTDFSLMTDIPESSAIRRRTIVRRRRSRNANRLYRVCRLFYYVHLLLVGLFVLCSVRYYPKKPVYNICSSPFAWKSIVDSMTSFKVEAHFEILVSVSNPNHFDVAVDMMKGTFMHDDTDVGVFEVPPVVVPAASLIDLLLIATFTPETWEGLKLSEQYHQGTLVLTIDSTAMVRVPTLANFTFKANVHDMEVKVSDPRFSDRHLCACPTWDDEKNRTHHQPSSEGGGIRASPPSSGRPPWSVP